MNIKYLYMTGKNYKKVALGLLLFPLSFFLLFLFGEIFSGDISGLSHLLQIIPLAIIIFVAYKNALVGGVLLLVVSLLFEILYLLNIPFDPIATFIVELLIFVPLIISGILLIRFSKQKNRESHLN